MCGRRNRLSSSSVACQGVGRGPLGAVTAVGSRTSDHISSHASAPSAASTPKPQRQLLSSINQASGVAVASTPSPLMLMISPDTAVNPPAGK